MSRWVTRQERSRATSTTRIPKPVTSATYTYVSRQSLELDLLTSTTWNLDNCIIKAKYTELWTSWIQLQDLRWGLDLSAPGLFASSYWLITLLNQNIRQSVIRLLTYCHKEALYLDLKNASIIKDHGSTYGRYKQRRVYIVRRVDTVPINKIVSGQVEGEKLWWAELSVSNLARIHHP